MSLGCDSAIAGKRFWIPWRRRPERRYLYLWCSVCLEFYFSTRHSEKRGFSKSLLVTTPQSLSCLLAYSSRISVKHRRFWRILSDGPQSMDQSRAGKVCETCRLGSAGVLPLGQTTALLVETDNGVWTLVQGILPRVLRCCPPLATPA